MWPFRRSQTPPNVPERHTVTLDLIEQVAYMRGQINALEDDWKSTKEQVRKDYQRVEKANERAERRKATTEEGAPNEVSTRPATAGVGAPSPSVRINKWQVLGELQKEAG